MAEQNGYNPGQLMTPPDSGVKVRMYRMGLGDCFLLAFATGNEKDPAYYMLIDCGSIGATAGGPSMKEVADDIKAATGGQIHLLVVTHRHADHIAGFGQPAWEGTDRIQVHNLWLPWLEDLTNPSTAGLWKKACQAAQGLNNAAPMMAPDLKEVITGVAEFMGGLDAAAAGCDPLKDIKAFVPEGQVGYHHPEESPLPLPAAGQTPVPPGVKLYVLGPPKDDRYLYHQDATQPGETYFTSAGLTSEGAFLLGVLDPGKLDPDERILQGLSLPFEKHLGIEWAKAAEHPFFGGRYGLSAEPDPATAGPAGSQPPPADADAPSVGRPAAQETNDTGDWRKIDNDWLGTAAAVATALDQVINNTTLPLAIELPNKKKVLMFVGDAQVGSWQSWHDLWTGPDGEPLVADLFKRTVLYKVGHHGSVNATAQCWANPDPTAKVPEEDWGLPLMTNSELVAMLPVDTVVASHKPPKPNGWVMPCKTMYEALCDHTRGRIIRVDSGLETPPPGAGDPWVGLQRPVIGQLYDEYVVQDE